MRFKGKQRRDPDDYCRCFVLLFANLGVEYQVKSLIQDNLGFKYLKKVVKKGQGRLNGT
jgi:hypothetical protein